MAFTAIYNSKEIPSDGTYKVGVYFNPDDAKRKLVDENAKEICLTTRFLSLPSYKLHYDSKQALRNDMIKGDNN